MSARTYRPSGVLKFEDCPRAFYYQYVEGIRSVGVSSNLVFGTAVHTAVTGYLDGSVSDPATKFREEWAAGIEKAEVHYTSRFGPDDLEATGASLCDQFPEAWQDTGLVPLVDAQGPVIERRFKAEVAPAVYLSGQLDIAAMNCDGDVHLVDVKTPASVPDVMWQSDQLTGYQSLIEDHKQELGIESVTKVGFMNLLKRKVSTGKSRSKGPEIQPIEFIPARKAEDVLEYKQKIRWMDEDIAKGRFPRRGRMAHNTPCGMCDYAGLCLRGDWEGLEQPQQKAVANLV